MNAGSTFNPAQLQQINRKIRDTNALATAETSDELETPQLRQRVEDLAEKTAALRNAPTDQKQDRQRERNQFEWQHAQSAIHRSLAAHVHLRDALHSRLVWFWTNHFSVYARKAGVGILLDHYEQSALAPRILGSFRDILIRGSLHPVMLAYLDNHLNRAGRVNENLAREILELHTLGVNGGYTQQDVGQLALALTGITPLHMDAVRGERKCNATGCIATGVSGVYLRIAQHARGPKVLLGKRYERSDGLEVLDMLEDLAAHPSTATFISQKLCQYWLEDEPAATQVESVRKAFLDSGGDLLQTHQQILALKAEHRHRSSRPNMRLKDPFRHLVDAIRLLSPANDSLIGSATTESALAMSWADRFNAQPLEVALRNLGMPHLMRLSPDGYPLASHVWNNSDTLLQRLQACNLMVGTLGRMWTDVRPPDLIRSASGRFRRHLSPDSLSALQGSSDHPGEWLAVSLMTPEIMFE